MPDKIYYPHDKLVFETLVSNENAVSFLEQSLPEAALSLMNLPALTVDTTRFVSKQLKEHYTDLLYQVPLKNGGQSYVYVLLEHQARPDKFMPLRMLEYLVQIWHYLLKKHKTDKLKTHRLPPVIPLVLSQSRWIYSPHLHDMLDWDDTTRKVLAPWIPDYQHLLVDLSAKSMKDIEGSVCVKILQYLLKCGINGLGRACQRLIDYGRREFLRDRIFSGNEGFANLCHYVSPDS